MRQYFYKHHIQAKQRTGGTSNSGLQRMYFYIPFSPPKGEAGVFLLLENEATGVVEHEEADAAGFMEGGHPIQPVCFGGGISSSFDAVLTFNLTMDCIDVDAARL